MAHNFNLARVPWHLTPERAVAIGRNDPCPCGSGKKYKLCCGRPSASTAAVDPKVACANQVQQADRVLFDRLMRFARKYGGPDWLGEAMSVYVDDPDARFDELEMQLAIPWVLYHCPSDDDGRSMAELMLADHRTRLTDEQVVLLDAQLNAWISVWDVLHVDRGVGMTIKDLLTGEERYVHEVQGTQDVKVRHVILGRVVDCKGISILAGIFPHVLSPGDAAHVVNEMRRVCRVRTRPVKPAKLRDPALQLDLIGLWRTVVANAFLPKAIPQLHNMDGDPFELTTDLFEFPAPMRQTVIDRLARLPGASDPDPLGAETEIVVSKAENPLSKALRNTIIGRLVVKATRLTSETTSAKRADDMRRMIESQLAGVVRHRLREAANTQALMESARANPTARPAHDAEVPPEVKAAVRRMREAHMLGWVDEQIPALGGITPREAATSARGRRDLDLLLRDFEHHEAALPEDERFDMGRLRTILGLTQ